MSHNYFLGETGENKTEQKLVLSGEYKINLINYVKNEHFLISLQIKNFSSRTLQNCSARVIHSIQ